MISRNYNTASAGDWREWSHLYWTAFFTVTDQQNRFLYYKKVSSPRCRQCRNLPSHMRWTGERVCICGNPYINHSGVDHLPLKTRLARGIKPWDKPLTSKEKTAVC